jgi:hypothetical protein
MFPPLSPNDCTLPLGDIPAGWIFAGIDNRYWASGVPEEAFVACLMPTADNPAVEAVRGLGSTPRAALLTAIAKTTRD